MNNERGSTLLMVIFSVCLCVVVMVGSASAASLYATQKKLFMLADGSALAASQSFDLANVWVTDAGLSHQLTDVNVQMATRRYLESVPTSRGVRVLSARAVGQTSAEVTLGVDWHPPVMSIVFPRGFPIEVTARARGLFS